MAHAVSEPDEVALPLRRSVGARGMRTGPLRILGPRRASPLPLALVAMLAAAGSAAAFIAVQPPVPTADEPARVELASPLPEAVPAEPAVTQVVRHDVPAPEPQSIEPPPVEPAQASNAAFGLDRLPVLEADETSLGIDDALDALSAPITPPARPAQRRGAAPLAERFAGKLPPAR